MNHGLPSIEHIITIDFFINIFNTISCQLKKGSLIRIGKLARPLAICTRCILPSVGLDELKLLCFPMFGPSIFYLGYDEGIRWLAQMS
jgi:hypothetical protein